MHIPLTLVSSGPHLFVLLKSGKILISRDTILGVSLVCQLLTLPEENIKVKWFCFLFVFCFFVFCKIYWATHQSFPVAALGYGCENIKVVLYLLLHCFIKSNQMLFIDYVLYSEYCDRQVGHQEITIWFFLLKHFVFSRSQTALCPTAMLTSHLTILWPCSQRGHSVRDFEWHIVNTC